MNDHFSIEKNVFVDFQNQSPPSSTIHLNKAENTKSSIPLETIARVNNTRSNETSDLPSSMQDPSHSSIITSTPPSLSTDTSVPQNNSTFVHTSRPTPKHSSLRSPTSENNKEVIVADLRERFLNSLIPDIVVEEALPIANSVTPVNNHQYPALFSFCQKMAINGVIMTTMIDYGYLNLFYSFYTISHIENYKNFFVIVLDDRSYQELSSRNIPVFLYKVGAEGLSSFHETSIITSQAFQKKVVNKLKIISQLLSYYFRVLYMDCDIILFKNPWPILNQYSSEQYDLVTQKDYTLNSGFMYIFPNEFTIDLFEQAYYHMLRNNELDQESLIAVLPRHKRVRLVLLPEHLFANGKVFFNKYQFYSDLLEFDKLSQSYRLNVSEVFMHNNFIVGGTNKLYRMRELYYYNDDSDQYYSSLDRKYLVVDAVDTSLQSPRFLLQVACLSRLLNRTFLLPSFPCPESFQAKRCNLCRQDVECYKKFRGLIDENLREYSFRNHEKVPEVVRNEIRENPVYSVKISKKKPLIDNSNSNSRSIVVYYKLSKKEIRKAFEPFRNDRVLKLSNLPKIFPINMKF